MSLCGLGRVLLRPRPRSTPLLPTATASSTASAVRATSASVHTAVLLMNMGGPSKSEEVHGFLNNLFNDRDLMCIGPAFLQPYVADYITKRRTPKIQEQYNEIGGGSPIGAWTQKQGEALCKKLDERSPETAPHKHYIGFRYAKPLTSTALEDIRADGAKRVVAFTQYPQYSCSTTGSSLNELYREIHSQNMTNLQWQVIDRWPTHPKLVSAFASNIREALKRFPEEDRKDVIFMFSAHSLPMKVVNRGDPYPQEVGSTVQRVMEALDFSNPYRLCWQSKVGPLPWLGPNTEDAIKGFHGNGKKKLMLIPIAFTTDHIETLFELDIEYIKELKEEVGDDELQIERCDSLNMNPDFIEAQVELVQEALQNPSKRTSRQMLLRCPGCTTEHCGTTKQFFGGDVLMA